MLSLILDFSFKVLSLMFPRVPNMRTLRHPVESLRYAVPCSAMVTWLRSFFLGGKS